jgi:hypothetical protein
VDSTTIRKDSLFVSSTALIPLTVTEIKAYETIDSDLTIDKAFKPKGFLAKMANVTSGNERRGNKKDSSGIFKKFIRHVSPDLWYNRVEGGHFGLGYEIDISKTLQMVPRIGYTTPLNRWSYGGELKWLWGKKSRRSDEPGYILAGYSYRAETRYQSEIHSKFSTGLVSFLGEHDYFDYFWNQKAYLSAGYDFRKINIQSSLQFNLEKHRSLEKETNYNVLGLNRVQRPNPKINDGDLRSFKWRIGYGGDYIPLGVVSQNYLSLEIEHSPGSLFKSDFNFTTYRAIAEWSFPTFFKRRFMSNMLIVRFTGGTFSGKLPVQRFGIVESSQSWYMPFGTLRTNQKYPYEGEQYAAFFWEHNFRTIPFEMLGLNFLVKNNISFLIFGGSGRTWISNKRFAELNYIPKYTPKLHHEIGASISGIFELLRFDVARRIDSPRLYYGISMARLF